MKITITSEVTNKLPEFDIIAFTSHVQVKESDVTNSLVDDTEARVQEQYEFSDLLKIPEIDVARKSYKTLGADPNRVHLAVESLYRRILKGNSVYRVNNLVDIGNVLSIDLKRSVAVLDLEKIKGDIEIKVGDKSMEYFGIGRGKININNIPIYCDEVGPFGCPTSDTTRTMITDSTSQILVMIICFNLSNKEELKERGISLFEQYGYAHDSKLISVNKE